MKKSIASDVELSVVPVDNNTILPVPFCTPPDTPVEKVAVEVVVFVAAGIVPVDNIPTLPNLLAPMPAAKPFVQLAISAKFSVYVNPGCADIGTGVCAKEPAHHSSATRNGRRFFIRNIINPEDSNLVKAKL